MLKQESSAVAFFPLHMARCSLFSVFNKIPQARAHGGAEERSSDRQAHVVVGEVPVENTVVLSEKIQQSASRCLGTSYT